MRLKDLLVILHVMTKVKVIRQDYSLVASGYPTYLFGHLAEETLNIQIVCAQAMNLDEMNIMVIGRK